MEQGLVRMSHGDAAEANPELEIAVLINVEYDGSWFALSAPGAARPPVQLVEGPVVVTRCDAVHIARADAWAQLAGAGDVIVLVGASPFVPTGL